MPKTQEYRRARQALKLVNYWPTEAGTKTMQSVREQARCKLMIIEDLDRLEPDALLAVTAIVASLAEPSGSGSPGDTPSQEAQEGP